jgi:hypothetical protein
MEQLKPGSSILQKLSIGVADHRDEIWYKYSQWRRAGIDVGQVELING